MKVTVTQGENKVVFTWNETCDECDYVALGFGDSEIEEMISLELHMGAQVPGYNVDLSE